MKLKVSEAIDYRLPENRKALMFSWAEAMYETGELDQQLRLMNWALDKPKVEEKLWLAFLWGCCYNFTGPWVIMSEFSTPPKDMQAFADWYNQNFERIRFDTDCRYRKSKMIACVQSYVDFLNGRSQAEALQSIMDEEDAYQKLNQISESWKYYGRLSTWNYLEALALVSEHPTFDCNDFLLTDVTGSESNRNGVAFIIGREDLLTKHGRLKTTGKVISQDDCSMLNEKAEEIFLELKAMFPERIVKRFSTETIFCWTKKRFRRNSTRYLGWDDERTIEEINFVKENWPEVDVSKIYEARKAFLPEFMAQHLSTVQKEKMPVFFETGTPVDLVKYQNGERWVVKSQVSKQSQKPQNPQTSLW